MSSYNNRPFFSATTTTNSIVSQVNGEYVFSGFNHFGTAIAILEGEPYYEKLPFSTSDPNIQISLNEFINLCTIGYIK